MWPKLPLSQLRTSASRSALGHVLPGSSRALLSPPPRSVSDPLSFSTCWRCSTVPEPGHRCYPRMRYLVINSSHRNRISGEGGRGEGASSHKGDIRRALSRAILPFSTLQELNGSLKTEECLFSISVIFEQV